MGERGREKEEGRREGGGRARERELCSMGFIKVMQLVVTVEMCRICWLVMMSPLVLGC